MEIDIAGAAIDGGRAMSGVGSAVDFSGGGFWTVTYSEIAVFTPDQHRYWTLLRNRLNGGVRSISVPLLTDWVGPFPTDANGTPQAMLQRISFDDGAFFDDGSGFAESTVEAEIAVNAALNAGTVSIRMILGQELQGGETFSIAHPNKGDRAYSIDEIDSVVGNVVTCSIRPPLREAVTAGTYAEFSRPRCLMRLPPGATLPWSVRPNWESRPSVTFIEAI
jgi:hypothetical protein